MESNVIQKALLCHQSVRRVICLERLGKKAEKKKKEKNVCIMKEQFADALQVLKNVGST